jgi:hypothetical protein
MLDLLFTINYTGIMNSIKDKLREKLFVNCNYRFSNEYYNKLKYECYVKVSDKLNIDLKEKCDEVNFQMSEHLYWNDNKKKLIL